jgi:hypothetical protein
MDQFHEYLIEFDGGKRLRINISHSMIVQNPKDYMSVYSKPDASGFRVKLPLQITTKE